MSDARRRAGASGQSEFWQVRLLSLRCSAMMWTVGVLTMLLILVTSIVLARARRKLPPQGQVDAGPALHHTTSREDTGSSRSPIQSLAGEHSATNERDSDQSPPAPLGISAPTASTSSFLLPAQPTLPPQSPLSGPSAFIIDVQPHLTSTISEASRLALHELQAAVKRCDSNLLLPLRTALIGLVRIGDNVKVKFSIPRVLGDF